MVQDHSMDTLTTLERGAVYGVSGLPWCAETLVSAKSLKRVMPGLPLELHIDRNTQSKLPEHINLEEYFDFVEVYDEFDHWRGPKFSAMLCRGINNSGMRYSPNLTPVWCLTATMNR